MKKLTTILAAIALLVAGLLMFEAVKHPSTVWISKTHSVTTLSLSHFQRNNKPVLICNFRGITNEFVWRTW